MKARSIALAAHQAQDGTTLAWCWKITRRDAAVFGFTSHDQRLVFDGLAYEATSGFTPSAIAASADLAVDNLEVNGLLTSASITEADLLAGVWDGAAVEIFELNWADLSQGRMLLRTGTIGNVTAGRTAFTAELRGLTQALQQSVGRIYAAACDATLGDARCGVNTAAITVVGAVTSAASRRQFTASGLSAQPVDWFGGGLVRFTSGANAGLGMEVQAFTAGGVFTLHLPMPHDVAAGDTFEAVPGCRKRFADDCVAKFTNGINFRGFPHVPGNDAVIGNAGLDSA